MVAPDENDVCLCEGKAVRSAGGEWEKAVEYWRSLASDEGAAFDRVVEIDAAQLSPFVTWGRIRDGGCGDGAGAGGEQFERIRTGARLSWLCSTWGWSKESGSRTSESTRYLLGRARTRGWRICGRQRGVAKDIM